MRKLTLTIAVLLAIPLLPVPAAAASPPCAEPEEVPLVGLVCRVGGLLLVLGPDGQSLGTTHGVDPAGGGPYAAASGPVDPRCVAGDPSDYHIQVIYARASDDIDQYATRADEIRTLTRNAAGVINDAGVATGSPAFLRVKCVSGSIEVKNEVLPTPKASANFGNIVSDLEAKGYTNGRVKHWVFYDEGACGCGVGHIYGDDSLAVTNLNNGNGQALFAVSFNNPTDTRVWTHELAHTMGAVQKSAPHSTDPAGSHPNGWHCTDGRDTMCYNDGAPLGGAYSTGVCAVEVFDCGNDDYFDATPTGYLSEHWNLGSRFNRFIQFGYAPAMSYLSCTTPIIAGETASTCSIYANDADSTGVRYTVQWGDGATSCVPTCSTYAAPGAMQTTSHVYATVGSRIITVTATDNGVPALTSNPATQNVYVQGRPSMPSLSCTQPVALGSPGTTCSMVATDADSTGVRYAIDWGDGTTSCVPSCTGTVAPGASVTASHAYASTGFKTVTVTASDNGPGPALTSSARTASVEVRTEIIPPTVTLLEPRAGNVYQGCTSAPAPLAPRPAYVVDGCVRVVASDASGIASIQVTFGGVLVATDPTPADGAFMARFPAGPAAVAKSLVVTVRDTAGNQRTAAIAVDVVGA